MTLTVATVKNAISRSPKSRSPVSAFFGMKNAALINRAEIVALRRFTALSSFGPILTSLAPSQFHPEFQ